MYKFQTQRGDWYIQYSSKYYLSNVDLDISHHMASLGHNELNHWCLEIPIICQWTWLSLVKVMAWCLFGTVPLPELMLTYNQLDPHNTFQWNFKIHTTFTTLIIQERQLENIVCQIPAILLQTLYVNFSVPLVDPWDRTVKYGLHTVRFLVSILASSLRVMYPGHIRLDQFKLALETG